MYSWARRVVFRKAVSALMWAHCGIVAGSATATAELWVHLAAPIGRLSHRLLQELADQVLLWEVSGRWPEAEAAVHTVLIPKATGGERPIGIFRSVTRVLARCKAWQARQWLDANSPAYVNAARGRRVGDAMWRTQVRAACRGEGSHAAEVMLDLKKAFELVQRGLLAQAAADAGYPLDVLAWGLSAHTWARRVV